MLQRSCSVGRWGRKVSHLRLASADLWLPHSSAGPCSKFKGRSCLETHCASMEMTKPETLSPSSGKDKQILAVWRKRCPPGRPDFYGWCPHSAQLLVVSPGTVGCILKAPSRCRCTQLQPSQCPRDLRPFLQQTANLLKQCSTKCYT